MSFFVYNRERGYPRDYTQEQQKYTMCMSDKKDFVLRKRGDKIVKVSLQIERWRKWAKKNGWGPYAKKASRPPKQPTALFEAKDEPTPLANMFASD